MLNAPLISLTTLTPGGVTHVVSVRADAASLYVITEDAFTTDAVVPDGSADVRVDVPMSDIVAAFEFAEAAFSDLSPAVLQLMAGHRALQQMLTFQAGYLPFEAALNLDLDKPAGIDTDANDDDLNLDEGIFL